VKSIRTLLAHLRVHTHDQAKMKHHCDIPELHPGDAYTCPLCQHVYACQPPARRTIQFPPIRYVPRFKAGFLAHMFTKGVHGGFVIGKGIANSGSHYLAWPDGSRVDTEQLFRPVGWKGLY